MGKSAKILDGRVVADAILQSVKTEVEALSDRPPHLVVLRVGNDGASISYVRQKMQKAAQVGIDCMVNVLDTESTHDEDLIKLIHNLNEDPAVDGILVQAPLPGGMDFTTIVGHVLPEKDVDGFGAYNCGRLLQDLPRLIPCTPAGIIELLKYYQIPTVGQHVVIVNRSLIVGKPLAALLLNRSDYGNASVTLCHSKSKNLQQLTQSADILVLACGRPHFLTPAYVKPGAVVIDVGITRVPANNERGFTLQGDADFDALQNHVSAITPVPGGVGPLTVAMLMKNTLKAYRYVKSYRSPTRSSSSPNGQTSFGNQL